MAAISRMRPFEVAEEDEENQSAEVGGKNEYSKKFNYDFSEYYIE